MIEWSYIVVALSLLLLAFLLWKEVSRRNKARLTLRVLSTLFAVACLACLAIPITYKKSDDVFVNETLVLLTKGFNKDSVNNFLSANEAVVFTMDDDLQNATIFNPTLVANAREISNTINGNAVLHVFGYGLPGSEIKNLDSIPIVFHPSLLPTGITSIDWKRHVKTGERILISGYVRNAHKERVKIILKNFDTTLDSFFVAAGSHPRFRLSTVPKHIGRAVYSVTVLVGNDTIEKELVPIQVERGEAVKVLLLASSPDFEFKFLKDHLSQNGFEVVSKTTISKNKFAKNYFNTKQKNVDGVLSTLMGNSDIAIAHAAALNTLSQSELSAIRTQVDKGRGLIVIADSAEAKSFYNRRFQLVSVANGQQQKLQLSLWGSAEALPALQVVRALSIRNLPGTQPVVTNQENKIFASSALSGAGKVILTTITNTYTWSLEGYNDSYDKYWAVLLNNVMPKQSASEFWSVAPALAEVNKPVQLQVQTNSAVLPKGLVGTSSVYLASDDDLPFRWRGTFYPVNTGWQTGMQMDGKPYYWYAYNQNDWMNIKAAQAITGTKQYENDHPHNTSNNQKQVQEIEIELPKVFFFLGFLLFAGFLWVESKL